ncbi:MAG: flagellar basal body-associated protein FliL [Aeromonadaceae bacterium]
MAEEEKLELKTSGGKKKLIIIAALALLLIGGGAGGWFMFAGGGQSASKGEHGGKSEEEIAAEKAAKQAMYVVMPSPLVFNVPGKPKDRMVQIKVALLVRGPANEALAKLHTPLVEGALLKVVSTFSADEIITIEGKARLRSEALKIIQASMSEVTQKPVVEQLLFTGFVMQ